MPALSDRQADSDTAVLYAAKSTEDRHGSIPDQLAQCRTAAEAEGREVVAEHSDEDATAFKGNRGHGLTAAKDAAIAAAPSELWVQHSDRLARGDGITADHLAEVWFALRRHGVRLRSVQDDSNLEDAIRVVIIGERNWEDSARKAAATQAGKRRAAERGDPQFGIVPDGYRVLRGVDEHGRVTRRMELDPERVEIYRLIFDLALRGYSDRAIVLELDKGGDRTQQRKATHRPRPFDASRAAGTPATPPYPGLAAYRREPAAEGRWPRSVDPGAFHRLRA